MDIKASSFVSKYFGATIDVLQNAASLSTEIELSAEACKGALSRGHKVILCGSGGSAADAQHLAAELMGRFMIDRAPMAALSLTVDTSALTAIGNDYGFDNVFARQLRGIGVSGDVIIGMSTSGNSKNVVRAFETAREMRITTIGLTGAGGGEMARLSDILLAVPDARTSHIQEAHITMGHLICAIVERDLCSSRS